MAIGGGHGKPHPWQCVWVDQRCIDNCNRQLRHQRSPEPTGASHNRQAGGSTRSRPPRTSPASVSPIDVRIRGGREGVVETDSDNETMGPARWELKKKRFAAGRRSAFSPSPESILARIADRRWVWFGYRSGRRWRSRRIQHLGLGRFAGRSSAPEMLAKGGPPRRTRQPTEAATRENFFCFLSFPRTFRVPNRSTVASVGEKRHATGSARIIGAVPGRVLFATATFFFGLRT